MKILKAAATAAAVAGAWGILAASGPVYAGDADTDTTLKKAHGDIQAPVSAVEIKVEKAAGPDGYTVAEVYARRSDLDRKTVAVRGKVVKVSQGIMDRNWVHLRDGSGDPGKKTNNLVVTTRDLPKVGDVVTARGIVAKDRDFGYGYNYPVIVEQGSLKP